MNIVITIYKYKFSLYSAIFDLLAITYVATFKINPARIIAFYWLDSCVMFIFFMLFFKYIGIITWYFEIFFASFIFIAVNSISLIFVITFSEMAGYKFKVEEAYKILEPYFDLSPFLTLSALSNYNFYRKVCHLSDKIDNVNIFMIQNCIYTMFLFFAIFFVMIPLRIVIWNIPVLIIVAFLIVRNLIDRWRVNYIKSKESG